MNPRPQPPANQSDPASLDGVAVRRLFGLPAGCDDQAVNQIVGQLAAERKGIQPKGQPSGTLDEPLFRSMLEVHPGTSTEQLNSDLNKHIIERAATENDEPPADADDAIRRQLGISGAAWDRYGSK